MPQPRRLTAPMKLRTVRPPLQADREVPALRGGRPQSVEASSRSGDRLGGLSVFCFWIMCPLDDTRNAETISALRRARVARRVASPLAKHVVLPQPKARRLQRQNLPEHAAFAAALRHARERLRVALPEARRPIDSA